VTNSTNIYHYLQLPITRIYQQSGVVSPYTTYIGKYRQGTRILFTDLLFWMFFKISMFLFVLLFYDLLQSITACTIQFNSIQFLLHKSILLSIVIHSIAAVSYNMRRPLALIHRYYVYISSIKLFLIFLFNQIAAVMG
jgi:hypothetical protein